MADFTKGANEDFTIECDFATSLASGDALNQSNSSVQVLDKNHEDVTISMAPATVSVSGTKLTVKIQGGTNGELYDVKFKAETDAGDNYDKNVVLAVVD